MAANPMAKHVKRHPRLIVFTLLALTALDCWLDLSWWARRYNAAARGRAASKAGLWAHRHGL